MKSPSVKPLVKLSAPVRIDGLLERDTFDVPNNAAGTSFMTWWDKAASSDRDTVLRYAHANDICVTEALAEMRHEQTNASSDY